jgi:hypothetical protein
LVAKGTAIRCTSRARPRLFCTRGSRHHHHSPLLLPNPQSYEIDGAACGTGDWLQHSFDPAFAGGGGGGYGTGGGPPFTDYFTRFAARTGPVVLGGRNVTTRERTPEVWAVCRSFFDCPNLGWRRGDDVPQDCAGPGRTFTAFSVDDAVLVACGAEGPSPGPLSLYELRVPRLAWIRYGEVAPAGLFTLPLAQVQIEQLRGPNDGPSSLPSTDAAADDAAADAAAAAAGAAADDSVDDGGAAARRVNPANSITAKGGCLVALAGGPGAPGPAQVSTSYTGLKWVTTPAPFASRTRAGLSFWRPHRMAVLGGLAADGATYLTDGWAADYTLCCATACDPATGACTLCNGRGDCAVDAHNLCLCQPGWAGDWCELNASTPTGSRTPSSSPSAQPYDPSRGGGGVSPGALGGLALGSAAGGAVLAVASMLLLRRRRALRWTVGGGSGGSSDAAFSTSASLPLADDGGPGGGSGVSSSLPPLAGHPLMTLNPVSAAQAAAALQVPPSAPAYVAPSLVVPLPQPPPV